MRILKVYILDIDSEFSVNRTNSLLRPHRNNCAIVASKSPHPSDVLHESKLVIFKVISHAHQGASRTFSIRSDTRFQDIYALTYCNVNAGALSGGLGRSHRDVLALIDICAASIGPDIKGEVLGEVARCLTLLEGEPDECGRYGMLYSSFLYSSACQLRWSTDGARLRSSVAIQVDHPSRAQLLRTRDLEGSLNFSR